MNTVTINYKKLVNYNVVTVSDVMSTPFAAKELGHSLINTPGKEPLTDVTILVHTASGELVSKEVLNNRHKDQL